MVVIKVLHEGGRAERKVWGLRTVCAQGQLSGVSAPVRSSCIAREGRKPGITMQQRYLI